MITLEHIKRLAKASAAFHQALLVEGVDATSATAITGNFLLYFRMEIMEGKTEQE